MVIAGVIPSKDRFAAAHTGLPAEIAFASTAQSARSVQPIWLDQKYRAADANVKRCRCCCIGGNCLQLVFRFQQRGAVFSLRAELPRGV
jgi:hypothetical protein